MSSDDIAWPAADAPSGDAAPLALALGVDEDAGDGATTDSGSRSECIFGNDSYLVTAFVLEADELAGSGRVYDLTGNSAADVGVIAAAIFDPRHFD